jgi:hypothetical protein
MWRSCVLSSRADSLKSHTLKITVYWGATLCELVEIYHHFVETSCLHLQDRRERRCMWYLSPKDGNIVPGYMLSHPSRQLSTLSVSGEPQNFAFLICSLLSLPTLQTRDINWLGSDIYIPSFRALGPAPSLTTDMTILF